MRVTQEAERAKAKSVIWLFINGGPSHVDTFDYKPAMTGMDGKTVAVKTFGRGGKKNEGRIVERGTDAELVAAAGLYARLAREQQEAERHVELLRDLDGEPA